MCPSTSSISSDYTINLNQFISFEGVVGVGVVRLWLWLLTLLILKLLILLLWLLLLWLLLLWLLVLIVDVLGLNHLVGLDEGELTIGIGLKIGFSLIHVEVGGGVVLWVLIIVVIGLL